MGEAQELGTSEENKYRFIPHLIMIRWSWKVSTEDEALAVWRCWGHLYWGHVSCCYGRMQHAPRPFGFRQGDDLGVKDIVKGCHFRPQLEFIHCSGWKTYWHIENWSQDPWFNNMLLSLSRGVHQGIFPSDHWNPSAASTSAIMSIYIYIIRIKEHDSLSLYIYIYMCVCIFI